jgi:hypothetical protein
VWLLQLLPVCFCLQSFFRFWDVASFCINGMVFFFVGASVTNFLIRWGFRHHNLFCT